MVKGRIVVNPETLRAVRQSQFPDALRIGNAAAHARGMNYDSADSASVWFARQLEAVEARAYEIKTPELNALKLFPVSSSVSAGAESTTYRAYGYVGRSDVGSNYHDDIPRSDIITREATNFIRPLTTYYGYSVQEARNARFAGLPLETQKATSARKNIDIGINRIAWAGDPTYKVYGIFSPESLVPTYTLQPGASLATLWLGKTAEEILDDVLNMRAAVIANSNGVETPDSLAVPQSVLTYLARPFTVGGVAVSESIMTYLLDKVDWLHNIVGVNELEQTSYDTNIFSTQANQIGAAFLYSKDEEKFKVEIPLPFNQLPPQFINFETKTICEARTAGVLMYYPSSCLIVLGI
jgi:hypothetical protein